MERTTPKAAAAALAEDARIALQCVSPVEVVTTGSELGQASSLLLLPHGTPASNFLLLRKPDRSPYLQLEVSVEFMVIIGPGVAERKPFRANIIRYFFGVADLAGRELFAFHWHPVGVSDVRTPHLHVSVAQPVRLPTESNPSSFTDFFPNKVHFPTHRLGFAELVGFLIRELGVGPRRADWQTVLEGLRV